MTLLVNNAAGVTANDNTTNLPVPNKDPVFVANNLLTTVYAWAENWGGASIQLYVCPQRLNAPFQPVWFPVGAALTQNGFYSFQHRWGQIKAVVTGATADTAGLFSSLFDGI